MVIWGERRVQPSDARGFVLALLCAVAVLMVSVWVETERIAYLDGFNPHDLGTPLVGKLYPPFASLSWMFQAEMRVDTSKLWQSGVRVVDNPYERSWARDAFASERARLPWEFSLALGFLIVGAIVWTRPLPTSGLHGDARWATPADVRRSSLLDNAFGVVLGEEPASKKLLVHPGPQNVLAIGPPGVGKSDGIAVPTLLRTWPSSAIVFDPAGELRQRTACARANQTQVLVFDPRDPKSARFNPLAGIEAHDIDAIQTVLASYMFDRDLSEMPAASRFFLSSALELGIALVARSIELGENTLPQATAIYYAGQWKNDDEFFKSLLVSKVAYVQETGAKFSRMHAETRSNVIATLTQFLSLFRSEDVARVVSGSDFSAKTLRENPTTLYLIVRERDHAALNPLLRMVLTRLLDDLTAMLPSEGEQSILVMLDEFPLLKAPVIMQKLATARKFRLLVVLLAQALTQIRDYYGQNESVTGMCDVRVFYPTLDAATQELASQTCGNTTRWAEQINGEATNKTRSAQEIGRPLLLQSELAMLGDRIILVRKGEHPILARPIRSHRDMRFT